MKNPHKKTGKTVTDNLSPLEKEKQYLVKINQFGTLKKWRGFWALTGPGWMQSALTIGGGTAMVSLFAGAFYQYKLLWLQPLAMAVGIVMLSALSYQTLTTQERPFYAMKKYVHPIFAWVWAIATLVSTMIWHFSMYALATGLSKDVIVAVVGPGTFENVNNELVLLAIGLVFMAVAISVTLNYNKGGKGIKRFEVVLKSMVWFIIFCFLFIVIERTLAKKIQWGMVFKGFLPLYLPVDKRGITLIMGALSATMAINMTFLFGYSYLKRGWGKEHYGLAVFDMITGLLIPFTLATALMIIAAGATIYDPVRFADGATKLSPVEASHLLQEAGIPMILSRVIFGLGIVSMALNAIIMHMIISGFAACEIFNIKPGTTKEKLAILMPVPGILGVFFWEDLGPWIAIPTGAIAGIMLPVAYIGFFVLNNNKKYLGDATPRGTKAVIWNIAMLIGIVLSIITITYYLLNL